jgi:phosphate transport system substrate-binding protein
LLAPLLTLALGAVTSAAGPAPAPPTIVVKGSDTIGGELGPDLAKAFSAASPGVTVRWEALGSATAFVGLFDGTADLGASSRSVNAAEMARAKELGIDLREYVLGYDGIAVIVHPSNPIRSLTVAQLAALFSGKVESWSELGGPSVRPVLYGRPSYSGTHAFFKERVVRRGDKKATDEYAPRVVPLEQSGAIVAAVAADPAAVGYVGMGWVKAGVASVAVAPEAGAPSVAPTAEAVRTGRYPLYRPLLLYSRGDPQGELRRLLQFALAGEGRKLVAAHDFTPVDAPAAVFRTAPAEGRAAGERPAVRLHRIYFGAGRATIDRAAEPTLELIAREQARSAGRVHVVGHSDSAGAPEANARLAWGRAAAVAESLVRRGLHAEQLLVEVRASDAPLASNGTAAGRQANRRVDVELLPAR